MDAVTHCVTSDVTQIIMTEPLLTENFRATLSRYRDAAAAFNSARDNVSRIRADLEKNAKAADAANAEALAARNEAAALMRDGGASIKQIHELKGKERAAYTLGEDYRCIIAELQLALDDATLDARIAHCEEANTYIGVVGQRANEQLASASQTLHPLIHAVHILANAYSCQAQVLGGAQWQQLGFETSIDAALDRAFALVRRGVHAYGAAEQDEVLTSIERPSGRNDFPPAYAATTQQKRAEIARRRTQLREASLNTLY